MAAINQHRNALLPAKGLPAMPTTHSPAIPAAPIA